MILGKISDLSVQTGLSSSLRAIIKQALTRDLATLDAGRYIIDGEDIFINVMAFDTSAAESKRYELHREISGYPNITQRYRAQLILA
jgi:YhcH/YjgK/YiaL family protein